MDDRARREPPAPYETFEKASAEARALGTRNKLEYEYFVELRLDPRLPKEPDTLYPDFHRKGGWDSFLGKKPIVRTNPAMPAPHAAVPDLPAPAANVMPEPRPPPPEPLLAVAPREPEKPIPLPGGAKPSVLTARPRRSRPPPVEEAYEPPPQPRPKPPPPEPRKPKVPKMRRDELKTDKAKRVFDMFSCITGDWDD